MFWTVASAWAMGTNRWCTNCDASCLAVGSPYAANHGSAQQQRQAFESNLSQRQYATVGMDFMRWEWDTMNTTPQSFT
jgi:hypothetical protein